MPNGTAPDTTINRDPSPDFRGTEDLTGNETPDQLFEKSKNVVRVQSDVVIKDAIQTGEVSVLTNKESLYKEIFSSIGYTLPLKPLDPEFDPEKFEVDLVNAITQALDSEIDSIFLKAVGARIGSAIGFEDSSALVFGKAFAIIADFTVSGIRMLATAADPITMFNGQFAHTATDLRINGAGIYFEFVRTYNNQAFHNGPLGHNWDHNFNLWLRVTEDQNKIARSNGALREDIYVRHELLDYWVPPDGQAGVIQQNGSSFIWRAPNGTQYFYKQEDSLPFIHVIDRIVDRFGNFLAFTYLDGRLNFVEVNHPRRVVEFIYNELGKIVALRDYANRLWQYAYDDFGDLISVTTPATERFPFGLTTCYEYSSAQFTGELQHNLVRIIDAAGQLYLENEYGADSGTLGFNRVIRQRQGGGESHFEYEDVIEEFEFDYTDNERPAHQTTMVDRNGQVSRHIYNKFGNLLFREECIHFNGLPRTLRHQFRYNRDGNLIATLSPEGVITQYLYGREYFLRRNRIENQDEIVQNENLTIQERQSFNRLLAVVQRARYFSFQDLNLAREVWGDIFPDIFGAFEPDPQDKIKDIIVKYTYEPVYGQLLTQSDPRYTVSLDPAKQTFSEGEHERYEETLTRFRYAGPPDNPNSDPNRFLIEIKRPTPTLPGSGPVIEKFTRPDPNDPTGDEIPAYDPRGRLLRHVNPIGTVREYTYFPEAPNNPLREGYLQQTVVDPGGLAITTQYEVDDLGRVVAVHLPRSVEVTDDRFVTRTSYNELDQVTETTSSKPFEFKTSRFYDRNGKLEREERQVKDESDIGILGGVEVRAYCYDEEFNLIQETTGGADLTGHLVTKHRYDSAGQRVLTIMPQGNQMRFRYDVRLLPVAQTIGAGSDDAATTRTEYDGDGRVRRTFDARGNPTTFTLDAFGRVTVEEDALGHISLTSYDKAGNVTCVRMFERRADGYFLLARSETEYDELNRAIRSGVNRFDDPLGPFQQNELETKFLDPPGPGVLLITQTFYDAQGRVVRTVDPLLREQTIEYDTLDRVKVITDPLGNETRNRYDAHGNLVRRDQVDLVRDNGNIIGQRVFSSGSTYDELDRMVTSTDSLGNVTRYFYDSRGNQARRVDPLGNVVRTDYDIFNRRVATRQELTDSGLGNGVVQATATTTFEYDRNGNLVGVVDARGRRTQYRYDALDRRRAIIYPDESQMLYDYDRDGNLIRTEDNNGLQRRYTVDALGRTTRVDVDKSGLPADLTVEGATFEQYEYDGLDRQRRAENDFAHCDIRFNSLGWPLAETMTFTTPDAPLISPLVIEREFNNVGALVGLTYPNGRRLSFQRDDLDRLTLVQNLVKGTDYPGDPATPDVNDIASMQYAGRHRIRCAFGNGAETRYAHDGAGRIIEMAHASPTTSLLTIQYLFDAVGNVRIRHDISPTRGVAETFAYDSFYRLVNEATDDRAAFNPALLAPATGVPSDPISNRQVELDNLIGSLALPSGTRTFEYDLVGNRDRERLADGSQVDYAVKELDQYISRNGTTFTYDQNGNLKDDGQRVYIYDSLNRLVRVRDTASNQTIVRFFHDARARRILELTTSTATHLVWDGDDQIAEYRNGAPFALYTFADGVDRPLQIVAEGKEHWYHPDLAGSVRLLSGRSGDELVSYRYAPFGFLLENSNNEVYNPLRYTARRFDDLLGTYDCRSRQYDPSLGRFGQRDPSEMIDGTHLYIYAGSNPLRFFDPIGTTRQEIAAPEGEIGAPDAGVPDAGPPPDAGHYINPIAGPIESGNEPEWVDYNKTPALARPIYAIGRFHAVGWEIAYGIFKGGHNLEQAVLGYALDPIHTIKAGTEEHGGNFINPVYQALVAVYEGWRAYDRGDWVGVGEQGTYLVAAIEGLRGPISLGRRVSIPKELGGSRTSGLVLEPVAPRGPYPVGTRMPGGGIAGQGPGAAWRGEFSGGRWLRFTEWARDLAGGVLRKHKASGVGTGARSGQHGTPYLRAGRELKQYATEGKIGEVELLPEIRQELDLIGDRLLQKGGDLNHPGGRRR